MSANVMNCQKIVKKASTCLKQNGRHCSYGEETKRSAVRANNHLLLYSVDKNTAWEPHK